MVLRHELEDVVFAGGQFDVPLAAPNLPRRPVYGEVGDADNLLAPGAAKHRPDPREEFLDVEWFCQIIVGAVVEAVDFVERVVAGGEHDDGGFLAPASERSEYAHAVHLREHDVEDDHIRLESRGLRQPRHPVEGGTHRQAAMFEFEFEEPDYRGVVLDYEDLRPFPYHVDFTLVRPPCLRPEY